MIQAMTSPVHFTPEGYHTVTPYLILNHAAEALEFYQKAFGAVEIMRLHGPGGRIGHAEIQIGDSKIMLADECPEMDARGPETIGGSPMSLMLYVKDVDAMIAGALEAGAKLLHPIDNKFYGDRSGGISDPFGYRWTIATHIEDVAPEEISRRIAAMGQPG